MGLELRGTITFKLLILRMEDCGKIKIGKLNLDSEVTIDGPQ